MSPAVLCCGGEFSVRGDISWEIFSFLPISSGCLHSSFPLCVFVDLLLPTLRHSKRGFLRAGLHISCTSCLLKHQSSFPHTPTYPSGGALRLLPSLNLFPLSSSSSSSFSSSLCDTFFQHVRRPLLSAYIRCLFLLLLFPVISVASCMFLQVLPCRID